MMNQGMCSFLNKALKKKFTLVETAGSVEEAEELRKRCHFDLLIVDIKAPRPFRHGVA